MSHNKMLFQLFWNWLWKTLHKTVPWLTALITDMFKTNMFLIISNQSAIFNFENSIDAFETRA